MENCTGSLGKVKNDLEIHANTQNATKRQKTIKKLFWTSREKQRIEPESGAKASKTTKKTKNDRKIALGVKKIQRNPSKWKCMANVTKTIRKLDQKPQKKCEFLKNSLRSSVEAKLPPTSS